MEPASKTVERLRGHLTGVAAISFAMLVNAIIVHRNRLGIKTLYPENHASKLLEMNDPVYDFVIIGAGTAGCVLANRLSVHDKFTVLLLEAGDYPSASSEVPAFHNTLRGTDEDWQFVTDDDGVTCQSYVGRRCQVLAGKGLGGTSIVDNLHYNRASRYEIERFEDEIGDEKWDGRIVNFFYDRLERYKNVEHTPVDYGNKGDIHLDVFANDHFIKDILLDAAGDLGYERVQPGKQIGYVDNVVQVKNGVRFNMAKAFLGPAKSRKNLHVAMGAYATRLSPPEQGENQFKYVEVVVKNKLIKVKAKKEILVTAGAINTPKLLMLSGIGPKAHLDKWDLPVVSDLPVGANLHIHFAVPIFVGVDASSKVDLKQTFIDSTYLYVMHQKGPLADTNINDLVGFLNTWQEPYESPNVAVYHYFFERGYVHLREHLERMGCVEEVQTSIIEYNKNQSIIMFMPLDLRPRSRGKVRLNDTNPAIRPIIKGNFFSDEGERDFNTLLSGYKYVLKLIETEPLVNQHAQLLDIDMPNCRNFKFCTEAYLTCVIRNLGFPLPHYCGTCRMGKTCDPTTVVDEELQVKGVKGVRVADASVLPELISGSVHGTVAMIADRVSELIKIKWIKGYVAQPRCPYKNRYEL